MSILPIFSPPPSCFQVGLRAISGSTEKLLVASAARRFSAISRTLAIEPCRCFHNPRVLPGYLGAPRQYQRVPNMLPRMQVRTVFRFRAITHYTQLPIDYEDAKGLPFRKEDLNQREVNAIFGTHISAQSANQLLRIIHGRRVAGTLDDPELQRNTLQYGIEDKLKALEYLRKNIPVDEVINAGLRAEDELKVLEAQEGSEQEAEEEFEETSPQNPPSQTQNKEPQLPTGRLPRKGGDSPYGESNFDRIRAENIAKREAEEKRLEEERKKREEEEVKGNIGTLQTQQQKPKELSPLMKKYAERATSKLEAPPEMKKWERLLPALAMTVLICAAGAIFATTYNPPRQSWRLWPDVPPAAATCISLIGLNLVVWMLWKVPPLWAILNRYFILVAATPRPLQLVGAMFSHHNFGHLTANMLALWFFGTRIHDEIGRGNFLALYFASGAVGFMASLADLVLRRGLEYTTLGASGAVYGLVVAFFWAHRYDEFKILGYPPDPITGPQGLAFIGLILGFHLIGVFSRRKHGVDIASHLGGMAAGSIGAELVRRRMEERARARQERMKTMGVLDTVVVEKKERRQSPPPPTMRSVAPIQQR
ncbi:hypothetical protein DL770_006640 [Monosporascus sp. CRB-9-2]|nr:hypothetical protein DL770_006640 [Monosporascus sp. CRB-9-2]